MNLAGLTIIWRMARVNLLSPSDFRVHLRPHSFSLGLDWQKLAVTNPGRRSEPQRRHWGFHVPCLDRPRIE